MTSLYRAVEACVVMILISVYNLFKLTSQCMCYSTNCIPCFVLVFRLIIVVMNVVSRKITRDAVFMISQSRQCVTLS